MKLYQTLLFFMTFALLPMNTNAQQEDNAAQIDLSEVILVAGATGRTGQFVVGQLQELGYTSIRGIARNRDKAIEDHGNDIEWVEADVRDPATLKAAFAGVDKAISTIGASRAPDNLPEFVDYGGVKNMVDAAQENGLKNFILMSSSGVTDEDNELNRLFHNMAIWKLKGEDYLRDSGLTYSVVRPGGLDRLNSKGEYGIYLTQGDRQSGGQISRQDVAAVLIECLTNPDAVDKTFEVFNFLARFPESWRNDFGLLKTD